MRIELKACNNKLIVIENDNISYIFSYDSLIGLYYNNYLFFDSYYKNFSVTTNKHISYIKQYYYLNDESRILYLNPNYFDEIIQNIDKEILKKLIQLDLNNACILEYIKEYQNIFKYNLKELIKDKKYLNTIENLKEILINNGNFKIWERDYISLKTVNKIIITYRINNIYFDIIRTYKNNNGNLINIKIKNIKVSNISFYDLKTGAAD